jgi:hypothetical protein
MTAVLGAAMGDEPVHEMRGDWQPALFAVLLEQPDGHGGGGEVPVGEVDGAATPARGLAEELEDEVVEFRVAAVGEEADVPLTPRWNLSRRPAAVKGLDPWWAYGAWRLVPVPDGRKCWSYWSWGGAGTRSTSMARTPRASFSGG